MTVVTEQILDEMVQVIVHEIDPEQVYLFGSRAPGNARPDSDVDLLIVEMDPLSRPGSRWENWSGSRNCLDSSVYQIMS
jgi:predicted nucleotidyltransferase